MARYPQSPPSLYLQIARLHATQSSLTSLPSSSSRYLSSPLPGVPGSHHGLPLFLLTILFNSSPPLPPRLHLIHPHLPRRSILLPHILLLSRASLTPQLLPKPQISHPIGHVDLTLPSLGHMPDMPLRQAIDETIPPRKSTVMSRCLILGRGIS